MLSEYLLQIIIKLVVVVGLMLALGLIPFLSQNEVFGVPLNLLAALVVGFPLANLVRRKVAKMRIAGEQA